MPYFPTPNASNLTNVVGIFQYANVNYLEGLFGLGILVAIFFISFLSLKRYETEKAFAASMFLVTIGSILLFILDLIVAEAILGSVLLLGISVVLLRRSVR